jgi:nucleoside-diphosphate-sugar epimerase
MSQKRNILLFGASGAVGRAIIKEVFNQPIKTHIVIILNDINKESEIHALFKIQENPNKVSYEIYNKIEFFRLRDFYLRECEIIYCWGTFDLTKKENFVISENIHNEYLYINYQLLVETISCLNNLKIVLKNIVFLSSQSADSSNITYHGSIDRDYISYGISKKLAENFLLCLRNLYKSNVIIIRPGTLIGWGDKNYRLIGTIVKNSLNNESTRIRSAKSKRNYLNFDTLAKFCFYLLGKESNVNQTVFNISGEIDSTIEEIIKQTCEYLKSEYKLMCRIEFEESSNFDLIFKDDSRNSGFIFQDDNLIVGIKESVDYQYRLMTS